MGKYLDFENQEKGYKPFDLNKENIRSNKGKQICYVDKRKIDKYRGYYNVEYAIIFDCYYSQLLINEGNDGLDMRDIVECGIKVDD